MSNTPFQFGAPSPTTPFVFGANSLSESGINKMVIERQDLKSRMTEMEFSLNGYRQSAWDANERASKAEVNAKNARASELVARNLADTLRSQLLASNKEKAATMDEVAELKSRNEDLYNEGVALQKESDELREQCRQHLSTIKKLETDNALLESESKARLDALNKEKTQIDHHNHEIDQLKEQLDHQTANTSNVQDLLNNTYADLKQAKDEYKGMMKLRDDETLKAYELELKLKDLTQEHSDVQEENEGLRQQAEHLHELEDTIQNLQGDIDRLQDDAQDHDHVIRVKDQRVAFLETQVQKLQTDMLKADALANAATKASAISPLEEATKQQNTSVGDNLEAELGGEYDDASFVEPETLDFSEIYSVSFEPSSPPRSTFTTKLYEVANIPPARAAAPSLTSIIIDNATIETAPIKTAQILTSTIATQTETAPQTARPVAASNNKLMKPITIIHDEPVAQLPTLVYAPAPAPKTAPLRAFKSSYFSGFLALLVLALALLYTQASINLQAWETANGVGMYHTGCNRYQQGGAYGNGRLLFGQIPIAMDIGQNIISERIARFMATAIMRVEDLAGFSHQPHF